MNRRGFTLIEVVIALIITVTAGILLSQAWSGNLLRVRKATLYNNVALLLERKMVEMSAKYQGKRITEFKDEEGNFGDDFPEYRWTFTVQPFVMPDLTSLLSQNEQTSDQTIVTMMGQLREIMNKAILEGTVTVYVRAGDKEIPYTLSTYFIDYESDVNLAGGLAQ